MNPIPSRKKEWYIEKADQTMRSHVVADKNTSMASF